MNEAVQAPFDPDAESEVDQPSGKLPIEAQQLAIGLVFILAIVALVMLKGFLSGKDEAGDAVEIVEAASGD